MICTDKLLDGVSKTKCPQGILRGFTGKITLKDWRGYNPLNPNSDYLETVVIDEANRYSIMPTSTPEVRDDNLTVFIHGLSFSIKSVTAETLSALVAMSNIPVIIDLDMQDGSVMTLFNNSGGKILPSHNMYGKDGELSLIKVVNHHREAREDSPPISRILQPWIGSFDATLNSPMTLSINYTDAVNTRILGIAQTSGATVLDNVVNGTDVVRLLTSLEEDIWLYVYPDGVFTSIVVENIGDLPYSLIQYGDVSGSITVVSPPDDLILEFQMFGDPNTIFSPTIYTDTTEVVKWDMGDGSEYELNSPDHTFSDTSLRTIKVYGNGMEASEVTGLVLRDIYGADISGDIDITKLTNLSYNLNIGGNKSCTSITLPTSIEIAGVYFTDNNITGEIDLSPYQGDVYQIRLADNDNLSSIIFPDATRVNLIETWNTSISSLELANLSFEETVIFVKILSSSCPNLTDINLPTSTAIAGTLAFDGCALGNINLSTTPNFLNAENGDYSFVNNNMSQSEVDYNLGQFDNVSLGSIVGREINIDGNNAAPSATGLASKASLEAKGFTVNVSS